MKNRSGFALVLAAPLLAGCGFHPLYASNTTSGGPVGVFSNVYVDPIPERIGYELRNSLLDLMNSDVSIESASYHLRLTVREVREPLGFKGDASVTRYNYRLSAHYELLARPDETLVKKGDVRAISAYNVAQSPYATVAGQKGAEDRAAESVAERIRTELAVFFQNPQNFQKTALAAP